MHSHRLRITLANRIFALFSKNIFLYFFALQKTYIAQDKKRARRSRQAQTRN